MSQIPTANPSSDDADIDIDWVVISTANTSNPSCRDASETADKPVFDFKNIKGHWNDNGDCPTFKATLPETKMEELKIETDEDLKFLKLSKVLPAGDGEGDDVCEISKSFNLPESVTVNLNDFRASMEEGVLNITFPKPRRSKKKIMTKTLGVLAKAVPVIVVVASVVDKMSDGN